MSFFYTENPIAAVIKRADVLVFTRASKGESWYQQMNHLKENLPDVYAATMAVEMKVGEIGVVEYDGKAFVFVATHEHFKAQVSAKTLSDAMARLHTMFDNGEFNKFAKNGVLKLAIVPSGVCTNGKLPWNVAARALAQSGLCQFASQSDVLHVGIAKTKAQAEIPCLAPLPKSQAEEDAELIAEAESMDAQLAKAIERGEVKRVQMPNFPLSSLPETIGEAPAIEDIKDIKEIVDEHAEKMLVGAVKTFRKGFLK